MHIAAEMSTDNFIAVMRGQADDIIPGIRKYHAEMLFTSDDCALCRECSRQQHRTTISFTEVCLR